jgi:hypothetical protein
MKNMAPNPQKKVKDPETFAFEGWQADEKTGEICFNYSFDNGISFCEKIDFETPLPAHSSPLRAGLDAALEALNVAVGISYYKAFAPPRIAFNYGPLASAKRDFFQKLYVNGLGEFGHRNNIDVFRRINFADALPSSVQARENEVGSAPLLRRSAVLMGGGKDSIVSVEILRAAGEPMVLFAVNPRKPMFECAKAADLPLIEVKRTIDPRLFKLNDEGALNGHIPITAIVSLIAIAGAFIHGFDAVVLSNERSANEGNLIHEGHTVNHQYSKTTEFERDLREYVSTYISRSIEYFSLLRPLSELHIAQLLARTTRYDRSFTSCNAAFRIRPTNANARWCCNGPKCRFTFLALATTMPPNRVCEIFGQNMLEDAAQVDGFEKLVGLDGHKPWECVGEIAESSSAFLQLAEQPAWSDSFVVSELAPRLKSNIQQPERLRSDFLTPSNDHCMPKRYKEMLNAYIAVR